MCNGRMIKTQARRSSSFRVIIKGGKGVNQNVNQILVQHVTPIPLLSGRGRLLGPETNVVVNVYHIHARRRRLVSSQSEINTLDLILRRMYKHVGFGITDHIL